MKKKDRVRRGISFGTIFILCFTVIVTGGLLLVLPKLQGGTAVDLDATAIIRGLKIDNLPELSLSEIPIKGSNAPQTTKVPVSPVQATPVPAATEAPVREYTLTFGGSVMLESGINKACYYKDAKAYDYSELLQPLQDSLKGDAVFVSLENIIFPSAKVGDVVTNEKAAAMLAQSGFDHVFLGFPKLYDQGFNGLTATVNALRDEGMEVIGCYTSESGSDSPYLLRLGDDTAAVLHYTDGIPSKTAKKLKNDKSTWAIPTLDVSRIASDIAKARSSGATLVIVSLNWGKDNKAKPTDEQRQTAQAIADAGADVIIGTGSKTVQMSEYLSTARGKTLVCYSLGCLVCDSRDSANVAGMLLHLTLRSENGRLTIKKAAYTPTYTWHYRQDKQYYYRVLPSNRFAPDGMNDESLRGMTKALVNVQKTLEGAPLQMQ